MEPTKITINKSTAQKTPGKKSFIEMISKRGNFIIYIEVILIILLGFFVLVIPKWKEVTVDTEGGLTHWQEEKDKLQAALVDAQKLVKLYNNLDKNERDKLVKILPTEEDVPQLMNQLESLFYSEEIFLTDLVMTPVDTGELGGKIRTLDVEMTFSAPQDYYQFKKIMDKLERNVRILNIKSFRYSPGDENMSISAEAYFIGK